MQMIEKLIPPFITLFFAFGFLTPVITAAIIAIGWQLPFGLSPIILALLVAGPWGLIAAYKGRWL